MRDGFIVRRGGAIGKTKPKMKYTEGVLVLEGNVEDDLVSPEQGEGIIIANDYDQYLLSFSEQNSNFIKQIFTNELSETADIMCYNEDDDSGIVIQPTITVPYKTQQITVNWDGKDRLVTMNGDYAYAVRRQNDITNYEIQITNFLDLSFTKEIVTTDILKSSANTVLLDIEGRQWIKKNSGDSILGVIRRNRNYSCVLLISDDENAVQMECTYDTSKIIPVGILRYNNQNYYCSYQLDYAYSIEFKSDLNSLSNAYLGDFSYNSSELDNAICGCICLMDNFGYLLS